MSRGNDAVKLVGIVIGRLGRDPLDIELGRPLRLPDQFARDRDRLLLAGGGIVGRAGDARVHVGAAQFVDGDVLAGRRFHQRRTAEEDRAGAADDDVIFAQRRHIGAAGGAMAEHERNLRHAQFGQDRLVAENAAGQVAVGKDVGLQRQEAAGAVAQMHDRQPVLDGDIERAHDLLDRQRIPGAALHAGIVGMDDDFAAVDDADAADDACAGHLAAIVGIGGERGQVQETACRDRATIRSDRARTSCSAATGVRDRAPDAHGGRRDGAP